MIFLSLIFRPIGMDQTYLCEVYADGDVADFKNTFNFPSCYSWMKYIDDSHGTASLVSLESFALQRVFLHSGS